MSGHEVGDAATLIRVDGLPWEVAAGSRWTVRRASDKTLSFGHALPDGTVVGITIDRDQVGYVFDMEATA